MKPRSIVAAALVAGLLGAGAAAVTLPVDHATPAATKAAVAPAVVPAQVAVSEGDRGSFDD